MNKMRSVRYVTEGGICIDRASVAAEYLQATEAIRQSLDEQRGVLFTSNFEYPGRYTRWDIGFVNPPLAIQARGRQMEFRALNARGEVLLKLLRESVSACEAVTGMEETDTCLRVTLRPPRPIFFEEERSRQYTVFSVLRDVVGLFHSR